MKQLKNILLFSVLALQSYGQDIHFRKIPVDTGYSFRGLSVVDDSVVWVSGIKGMVGRSINGGNSWAFTQIKDFEKADFRTLYAFNSKEAVIANAGSPACILRTSDGGKTWEKLYTNKDSLAFFDGIDFWNDKEGVIYGDPIKGLMLLLKTDDGGKSWKEFPKESRPVLSAGEASFAASGTGIRCYGKSDLVIATGGKVSRLLISNNKGKTWTPIETPILQGESGTGIFSFAFAKDSGDIVNLKHGVIVGGDYTKDTLTDRNTFFTHSPKKIDFRYPSGKSTGGYRECVEFVGPKGVIAVGPGGSDYSPNQGTSWTPIENQKGFHVIRKARKGNLIIAAGSKKISIVRVNKP